MIRMFMEPWNQIPGSTGFPRVCCTVMPKSGSKGSTLPTRGAGDIDRRSFGPDPTYPD